MTKIRTARTWAAAGGAAALLAAVAMPATASAEPSAASDANAVAASGYVAILPYVAPTRDVAQGAEFPLVARDSSGISFAETWTITPAPNPAYYFVSSRLRNSAGQVMNMDAQKPDGSGGEHGDPVGSRPADGTVSQQWTVKDEYFGGTYLYTTFTNRWSKLMLTFPGTGFDPAYTQTSATSSGDRRFTVKQLG